MKALDHQTRQQPFNGDMKISDIPAASNMMLEVHCSKGIAICTTNRVDGTSRGYSIYFTVDEKRYESLPYTIEICRALGLPPANHPGHFQEEPSGEKNQASTR